MTEVIKITENESVMPEMISEISEVIEFCSTGKRYFCFTIVLNDNRIINILREYGNANRNLKELEIKALHKGLIDAQPQ
ncbi:MAG: hypothetical protein RAO94_01730 [Candidatus Stygibacter australis]|nr:hypothetical protein [Candidatus Stygibacter australis]MDP8321049.1 hypothetical protein [Candidatus Stygibacter australis]